MKPRCTLSENQHEQIYDFWLDEEVSIPTTDHRTDRNEVKIEKLRYIREYKHLENIVDENRKRSAFNLKESR